MGKITTNPKSIESRERKAENAAAKKAAIQKAKEDASWEDNDKHIARKADRASAAAEKREGELARKKANQELYEAEMAAAASSKGKNKKKGNENANKVTKAMILQAQMAQMEKSKKKSKKNSKVVEQSTGELEENINKLDLGPVASNVDDAIDLLSSSNDKEDRHPEKRMKASYKKFEEERYETVKQENPSLKRTQIKEIIWKEWQKSPENPMNQSK